MGVKQVATTNGFRLGLDWSNPPENIDMQALTQAQQCEFDRTDNALRTVPGIRVLYDFGLPIETLYYDVYRNKWYFSSDRNLYETDFNINKLLGTLSGTISQDIMRSVVIFSSPAVINYKLFRVLASYILLKVLCAIWYPVIRGAC